MFAALRVAAGDQLMLRPVVLWAPMATLSRLQLSLPGPLLFNCRQRNRVAPVCAAGGMGALTVVKLG